ncbi:MAG: hypothetical protein WBM32_00450 [Crocosphaera sp.]
MPIYIIRPKANLVTKSLSLTHTELTPESRQEQMKKVQEIYTTVKVLPENLIREFSDVDGIKNVFKQKKRFYVDKEDKKITGIDVANKYQFLTVLGAPGSGKSTLLRKVGLDSIKGTLAHKCIPN